VGKAARKLRPGKRHGQTPCVDLPGGRPGPGGGRWRLAHLRGGGKGTGVQWSHFLANLKKMSRGKGQNKPKKRGTASEATPAGETRKGRHLAKGVPVLSDEKNHWLKWPKNETPKCWRAEKRRRGWPEKSTRRGGGNQAWNQKEITDEGPENKTKNTRESQAQPAHQAADKLLLTKGAITKAKKRKKLRQKINRPNQRKQTASNRANRGKFRGCSWPQNGPKKISERSFACALLRGPEKPQDGRVRKEKPQKEGVTKKTHRRQSKVLEKPARGGDPGRGHFLGGGCRWKSAGVVGAFCENEGGNISGTAGKKKSLGTKKKVICQSCERNEYNIKGRREKKESSKKEHGGKTGQPGSQHFGLPRTDEKSKHFWKRRRARNRSPSPTKKKEGKGRRGKGKEPTKLGRQAPKQLGGEVGGKKKTKPGNKDSGSGGVNGRRV